MKTILLVCDGMADEPHEKLEGLTPLEAARTPVMDEIAAHGKVGTARTIPEGFTPSSDVGNLSILGFDPKRYYCGRGPLEAAHLGIKLKEGEVAFRANLVTADGDQLMDYAAGHISSEEAATLIRHVGKQLDPASVQFYPGVKYRHLAVFRDPNLSDALLQTQCKAPHDIMGWKISEHWPTGPAADRLIRMMEASREILSTHEVNQVRVDLKENPGNLLWFWGQGKRPEWDSFKKRFGVSGSVISAVDLVRGTGLLAGLKVINVKGATGYYDTNYAAKADAAIESLKKEDFVFVHVEAADEAGHAGDLRQKLAAIENFDAQVVGRIWKRFKTLKEIRILCIPDHATPVAKQRHTADPVPFFVYGKGIPSNGVKQFSESQARQSGWRVEEAHRILPELFTAREI